MKTDKLTFILAFVLGTLLLPAVYADSYQGKKDQRVEQRGDQGKAKHKDNKLKRQKQQQNKQRSNDKNSHTAQRRQDVRDHRKAEKQNNHQQRRYSTHRYDDHPKSRYDRYPRREQNQHSYSTKRHTNRYSDYREHDHSRHNRRYEVRHGKRLLLLTPRHRTYRNLFIVRPFGHSYFGYGHFLNDYNAWRWLTFTAITLKLLDMVDEQAQREHEAAQIDATTADVGERIYWDTDDASGYVVTTRQGSSSRGLQCREYRHSITVGNETEEAYGSACLQPDGSWKIVNDD